MTTIRIEKVKKYGMRQTLDFGMYKGERVNEIARDVRGIAWLLWADREVEYFTLMNYARKRIQELDLRSRRRERSGILFRHRDKQSFIDDMMGQEGYVF